MNADPAVATAPQDAPGPCPEGAHYRYRRGTHELRLALLGPADRQVDDVAHGEAEFALIVEGPLIVLGYRFGEAIPWSAAAPFHWDTLADRDRAIPGYVPLTPQSRSRLWSTLWITLFDATDGAVLARRAVALPPEFTAALHDALRSQASGPFRGAAGEHALAWLSHQGEPLPQRAARRARCAATRGRVAEPVGPVSTPRIVRRPRSKRLVTATGRARRPEGTDLISPNKPRSRP